MIITENRCATGVGFPMVRCAKRATRTIAVVETGEQVEVCLVHARIAYQRGAWLYVRDERYASNFAMHELAVEGYTS